LNCPPIVLFFRFLEVDLTVARVQTPIQGRGALWWRFGREAGLELSSFTWSKMPQKIIQLLASLLQCFATKEYHRHRSIHHAISFGGMDF